MNEPCKIITLRDYYTLLAAANWIECFKCGGTEGMLRDICNRSTDLFVFEADEYGITLPKKPKDHVQFHQSFYKEEGGA